MSKDERVLSEQERAFLQARTILKVFNGVTLREVIAWPAERRQDWYEDARESLERESTGGAKNE